MWYALQINRNAESKAARLLDWLAGKDIISDWFSPKAEVMMKLKGVWQVKENTLFPGYVLVETDDIGSLVLALNKTSVETNLLEEPLSTTESKYFDEYRLFNISRGVIKDGEVIIEAGPLKGHSDWIKKINRHKRLAYLSIDAFGQTINTKAGLEITEKI